MIFYFTADVRYERLAKSKGDIMIKIVTPKHEASHEYDRCSDPLDHHLCPSG
jgi:hypothetical protein